MDTDIVAIETKHRGWARFLVATVRLSTGGIIRREIEDHGRAVAVLPYDSNRRMAIMVRQFRAPVFLESRQEHLLECVAGILAGTDAIACARREAMEEAGIELLSLDQVATTWTMPGISTERMHLYLANYSGPLRKTEGLGLASEHEYISAVEIPLQQLAAMADAGEVADMKTFALVQTLRLRHGNLFA